MSELKVGDVVFGIRENLFDNLREYGSIYDAQEDAVINAINAIEKLHTDQLAAERRRFDFLAGMEGLSLAWFCYTHGAVPPANVDDANMDQWRNAIDRILEGR